MKRIIITPTFRPHFPYNRDFLRSLDQHGLDRDDIEVHFVASRDELDELTALRDEFPDATAEVHAFEDLLHRAGHDAEGPELLKSIGKFAFQASKKLFALKVLEYDQALVLDSEALLVKDTRIGEAFDAYFAAPYVYFSDLAHRRDNWYGLLGDIVNENASKLLGVPYPRMHLLEYYGWFYDKRIVTDLFAALPPDLLGAVSKLGRNKQIFECVLYYTFLFNNERYGYEFRSVNDLLRSYLGEAGYARYIGNFAGFWEQVGIFEYVSKEVTEDNLSDLRRLFQEHNLQFYRSEILNRNERAQAELITESPITFVVSSENYRRIRERVAVCVSGPRPRDRGHLKLLRDFLADSNIDLFLHFWSVPDQDVVVRTLEPAGHVCEDRDKFHPSAHVDLSRYPTDSFERPGASDEAIAGAYSAWRANELKRAHERDEGFTYDIVVGIGADLLALEDLSAVLDRIRLQQMGFERTLYVPEDQSSTGTDGRLLVGSSAAVDVLADGFAHLGDAPTDLAFDLDRSLLDHVLANDVALQTFRIERLELPPDEPLAVEHLRRHAGEIAGPAAASPPAPISSDSAAPPATVTEWFRAKAGSARAISELDLGTPKVFRLRRRSKGHDAPVGDSFVLVVAGDEDRTAVNLRARHLVLGEDGRVAESGRYNLRPDADGALRPDGVADADAAFFVSKDGPDVRFAWRPSLSLRSTRGGSVDEHLFLTDDGDGLSLAPASASGSVFALERVDDAVAEASEMGLRTQPSTVISDAQRPMATRLAWLAYTAIRVYGEGGRDRLVVDSNVFLRKMLDKYDLDESAAWLRQLARRSPSGRRVSWRSR